MFEIPRYYYFYFQVINLVAGIQYVIEYPYYIILVLSILLQAGIAAQRGAYNTICSISFISKIN